MLFTGSKRTGYFLNKNVNFGLSAKLLQCVHTKCDGAIGSHTKWTYSCVSGEFLSRHTFAVHRRARSRGFIEIFQYFNFDTNFAWWQPGLQCSPGWTAAWRRNWLMPFATLGALYTPNANLFAPSRCRRSFVTPHIKICRCASFVQFVAPQLDSRTVLHSQPWPK